LKEQLKAFMDIYIYPNEAEFLRQLNEGERLKVIPFLEALFKEKATGTRGCGTCSCRKANTVPD